MGGASKERSNHNEYPLYLLQELKAVAVASRKHALIIALMVGLCRRLHQVGPAQSIERRIYSS